MCSLKLKRNVHDPVWGDIGLTDEEWQLMALPAMQRLRRVHQLGLTMLVFPGANHTRFEHSLGVAHAAGEIGLRLVEDVRATQPHLFGVEELRLVRLAGLLHDVGHGVFSHVSDALFGRNGEERAHEWIGASTIRSDPRIQAIVGSDTTAAIAEILLNQGTRTVVRDVVSGPADADKLDYLQRDTYYTGVRHHFDHHHFIDQATVVSSDPESWLGFGWSGLWSVEGMLLSRHHLHRTVYAHRNRLVTDFMLQRGLELGMRDGPLPSDLLTVPSEEDFGSWISQYQKYDDWRVMSEGTASKHPVAAEMFRRLRDHDLLKLLVYVEDFELDGHLDALAVRRLETDPSAVDVDRIERAVADEIGCDQSLVIARLLHPDHVFAGPKRDSVGKEGIMLRKFDGDGYDPFVRRSEVFSSSPDPTPRRKLLVYGPMPMRDPATRAVTELAQRAERCALDELRACLLAGRS